MIITDIANCRELPKHVDKFACWSSKPEVAEIEFKERYGYLPDKGYRHVNGLGVSTIYFVLEASGND